MRNAPAPADDPFTAWLNGLDQAADHLLAIGVDRAIVLGLVAHLQLINVERWAALARIRRDALDQALADAPMIEAA